MKKNKTLGMAIPAIGLLLIMVVYQYGYLGIKAELASIKEQQDIKMKTLEKYTAIIAEKPELEKKLAALKEKVKANNTKLIEGEPVSLASANLQDTVKGIITGRGGTISSERIGKPEDLVKTDAAAAPGKEQQPAKESPAKKAGAAKGKKDEAPAEGGAKFKLISISIDASVPDPGALSDMLYSIETRVPYLVIKELDARVKNFKEPRDLMVKLDVSALYGGK
ncbi:MAG: hypothetical protein AB1553_13565 [Nitrospirota bacterium]